MIHDHSSEKRSSVGILDIFGFENFVNNRSVLFIIIIKIYLPVFLKYAPTFLFALYQFVVLFFYYVLVFFVQ